jgi:hypothetical protein
MTFSHFRGPAAHAALAATLLGMAAAPLQAQDAPRTTTVKAGAAGAPLPLKMEPRPTTAAITAQDLMTRLYIFADDSLMGRDVGTEGHYKATEYLAREAKRMGLVPAGDSGTYFQTLPLRTRRVDNMSALVAGGRSLTFRTEWAVGGNESLKADNVEVIYAGAIGANTPTLPAEQVQGRLVAYSVELDNQVLNKVLNANDLTPEGAAGALVFVPARGSTILTFALRGGTRMVDGSARESNARLFVLDSLASAFFPRPLADLAPGTIGTKVTVNALVEFAATPFPARNVVAMLPGSDPKLRNQYVAIGAHSDHVGMAPRAVDHDSVLVFNRIVRPGGAEDNNKFGTPAEFEQINAELVEMRKESPTRKDSIFNGADDDGSGSVAVQEIAEFLAAQKVKPKRSTLFVWHAGEERGLWGAAYYTEHPTVPRDSIVAQLNLDMVGRGRPTDQTGKSKDGAVLMGSPDYLQLVGSRRLSTELGDMVESINTAKKHNFTFDYAMDANGHPMNIYCRSDHYEYAKWGIPVTFFTTGGHSAYHQVTDEPQYIDYQHMTRISKLVTDIALELGNRAARPTVDKPKLDPRGRCQQ